MIICLITSFMQPVYAASDMNSNLAEKRKQEKIEAIFNELNEVACEKAHAEYLASLGVGNQNLTDNSVTSENSKSLFMQKDIVELNNTKKELNNKLKNLGVHKIDDSNKNDMKMLEQLESCVDVKKDLQIQGVYDTAPDLHAVANLYTLYTYNGNYKYNGSTYTYRYIKVVDDKGYRGLTENQMLDALGKYESHYVREVLNYNFGYIFSALLSSIPYGAVIDWQLGNIFAILNGKPESAVVSSGSAAMYTITHTAVTSMTYYWIYNNSWRYIGAGAECNVARSDLWAGNIEGKATHDYHYDSWRTCTSGIWYNYLEDYINVMSWNPSYCNINQIGSFYIKGISNSAYFTPKFASYPDWLI